MKKIILLILALNISCASKAQIFNLYNNANYGAVTDAYYKDTESFQNQFVGTWIYQNGAEYLEVQFVKKEMQLHRPGPNQIYIDVLVGEYKYTDINGVEKVNSIPNLSANQPSIYDYNLYSVSKISLQSYPKCEECPAGTERLYMKFDELGNDDFGLDAIFVIRHVIEGGVEKLKVQFIHMNSASNQNKIDLNSPSTFRDFSLPYGNYTLIKQ
jgi:hypothetical protein